MPVRGSGGIAHEDGHMMDRVGLGEGGGALDGLAVTGLGQDGGGERWCGHGSIHGHLRTIRVVPGWAVRGRIGGAGGEEEEERENEEKTGHGPGRSGEGALR